MAIDLGIGIGLQGTPREYTGLYQSRLAREEAARRAKEKAKNEEFDKFSKDIVAAQPKVHNILIDEAKNTMAQFLKTSYDAYAKGDPNAYNTAVESYLNAKAKFNELGNLTKQYDALEKYVSEAGRSGNYVSKSQRAAYDALRNARSREEFSDILTRSGINQNDPYLNHSGDGLVAPASQKDIDFVDRTIKDLRNNAIQSNYMVGAALPDSVKNKFLTTVSQIPKTQADADKIALQFNLQPGTVKSIEDYANALFQDPGIVNQYSDKFDVPADQARQHFIDNVASKLIQPEATQSGIPQERKININVNTSQDTNEVGSLSSLSGILHGNTQDEKTSKAAFTVDSPLSFTLGKDASLSLPNSIQTVDIKTMSPVGQSGVTKVNWNQVHLLPYITETRVLPSGEKITFKRVVDPNQVTPESKSRVKYGKFIYGSRGNPEDFTDESFYRPYDDIRQATFNGSDKNRSRFNDNIRQMNEVENQLNKAIQNGTLDWSKMNSENNYSGLGAVTPGEETVPYKPEEKSKPKFKW